MTHKCDICGVEKPKDDLFVVIDDIGNKFCNPMYLFCHDCNEKQKELHEILMDEAESHMKEEAKAHERATYHAELRDELLNPYK